MPSKNVFQYSKIRTRNKVRRKALKPGKKMDPAFFGIRNPLCWNPESSTRNPNPQHGIQNPRLSWIPLHGANCMYVKLGKKDRTLLMLRLFV